MRVLLLDDGRLHDVFEVVEVADSVVRARSPYLFELGEEIQLRIERDDGKTDDVTARVRAHVGADPKVTELELAEPV